MIVDRAAGETAVGVVPAGSGGESYGEVAPVNHVFAYGVGPVHVAPDCGVGVVLEKHVVEALPIDGGVGVVHPILGWEQVELWAEGIGGEFFLEVVSEWPCAIWKRSENGGGGVS